MKRHWVLSALALPVGVFLLAGCTFPFCPLRPDRAASNLEIDIEYTGQWYRETFGYERDAANIRHYVLVVPEEQAAEASAGQIFSALEFPGESDEVRFREGAEHQWALEYLHEAPGGVFSGSFEPGDYMVAVAFIAAPLSREEAGVGEDVILYAGITGGGASTEYQRITIPPDQVVTLTIQLTDADGWACPWLYVDTGHGLERRTEVLRGLQGHAAAQTEVTQLGSVPVVDGTVRLVIAEEKPEVTFLDALWLVVDGVPVPATPDTPEAALTADQVYLRLAQGESAAFVFRLPEPLAGRTQVEASVLVTGYYVSVP